jgi:hypothetical protein
MPQSMTGILAMIIFTLFAVQQQEKIFLTQNSMVRQAISGMLNGAAVERMDEIGSKAFDQAISDNEILTSTGELSATSVFGPGSDHTAEDDLDDFHAATDTLYRGIGADSLAFVVYSEVTYAQESNPELDAVSGTRTKYKKVVVTARSLTMPELPEIEVQRSFSCGSACQW